MARRRKVGPTRADAVAAEGSWSIKFARRNEKGGLDRFRTHINATLPYRYDMDQNKSVRPTAEEFAAKQEEARLAARAKAKALTEQDDVAWVTVYPPFVGRVNHWNYEKSAKGYFERVAPVSRWKRSTGWTQEEK
jgi:hypothetical protein